MEDESGRLQLTGELIEKEILVTGMAVAVLGRETSGGDFEVVDICYPQLDVQPNLKLEPSTPETDSGPWVAIASGLNIGAESAGDMATELFVDYLTGELGTSQVSMMYGDGFSLSNDYTLPSLLIYNQQDQEFVSNIGRLILAGNSLSKSKPSETLDIKVNRHPLPKTLLPRTYAFQKKR